MIDLIFKWIDDEHCDVYLDHKHIITMDHGPHGWDGMVGIRDALLSAAVVMGWCVQVFGEPGI